MNGLTILINKNVKMSPGKTASQAVHAALAYFGIEHGAVIVLTASPNKIKNCRVIVKDAGLTEVQPGTMTAGIE